MAIEFRDSVLCDRCSNAQRGVLVGKVPICLDCASDDPELLRQIVHIVMPDTAAKLERAIAQGLK